MRKKFILPLICGLFSFCSIISYAQKADIIFVNGKIFTADSTRPWASSLAIKGNKILAVGGPEIESLKDTHTHLIDLEGKTVIPGFNDAHYHHNPYYQGFYAFYPSDGSDISWNQLKDSIQALARRTPPGSFLFATMGIEVGTDTSITRFVLDSLIPDHPVLIEADWGHVSYFNTAAMRRLGISEKEKDIPGGSFGRFAGTQVLNGRAYEEVCNAIRRKKPTTRELFRASLKDLANTALYFGITSIQNMCTAAVPDSFIHALQGISFPLRFRLIRWAEYGSNNQLLIPSKNTQGVAGLPLVKIFGTKWMLDGTPIERFAELSVDYKDQPGWKGKMDFTPQQLNQIIKEFQSRKDQPLFHVVGDQTIRNVLNELSQTPTAWQGRRIRFEHADGLLPDLVEQAKSLGIIVVQNPVHFTIGSTLHQRYPDKLLQQTMPLKFLLRAGIPVALGSDGPLNPFLNIMFACMHPVHPSEALTREEAVRAYTQTAAYAEFEDNKGTLMPGQLADLAVLSEDLFTVPLQQLPSLHSVLTMIDGKIVFTTMKK